MNIEGFKYIAISNTKEILILNSELIQSTNISEFGIKLDSFPSFSKAAGTQR